MNYGTTIIPRIEWICYIAGKNQEVTSLLHKTHEYTFPCHGDGDTIIS